MVTVLGSPSVQPAAPTIHPVADGKDDNTLVGQKSQERLTRRHRGELPLLATSPRQALGSAVSFPAERNLFGE